MEDKLDLEVYTKAGTLRTRARRAPKINSEQQDLITKWYDYARKVAFKRAYRPYDPDEVLEATHDALILASRYYKPNLGHKSFGSYFLYCLLPIMARKWKKRQAKTMARLPIVMSDDHFGPTEFDVQCPNQDAAIVVETSEYAAHVLRHIPNPDREILRDQFILGTDTQEAADKHNCTRTRAWKARVDALERARRRFA